MDVLEEAFALDARRKNLPSLQAYREIRALEAEKMEAAEAHINFSDRRFKRIPTIEATHQKIQKRIATI